MNKPPTCKTCLFFDKTTSTCRAAAPTTRVPRPENTFPQVYPGLWCADHPRFEEYRESMEKANG